MTGMDATQLLLPHAEWNALAKPQDAEFQEWLGKWRQAELQNPPQDDLLRRQARYGHYLAWTAARKVAR
jgi:hypothetical protein